MAEKYKYRKTKIILLLSEYRERKKSGKMSVTIQKLIKIVKMIIFMKNYYYLREQETDTLHIQYM